MELRCFEEVTLKGPRQYFEMGSEGERHSRMEPRFLICETGVIVVVPVTEIQRVESMHFVWVILNLRKL